MWRDSALHGNQGLPEHILKTFGYSFESFFYQGEKWKGFSRRLGNQNSKVRCETIHGRRWEIQGRTIAFGSKMSAEPLGQSTLFPKASAGWWAADGKPLPECRRREEAADQLQLCPNGIIRKAVLDLSAPPD